MGTPPSEARAPPGSSPPVFPTPPLDLAVKPRRNAVRALQEGAEELIAASPGRGLCARPMRRTAARNSRGENRRVEGNRGLPLSGDFRPSGVGIGSGRTPSIGKDSEGSEAARSELVRLVLPHFPHRGPDIQGMTKQGWMMSANHMFSTL